MSESSMIKAFEDRARRCRHHPTVTSGSRFACACEILRAARELADRLLEAGARPAIPIGLSAPNGVAFLAGLIAIRLVRAPALLLDARAPEEERRRISRALGAGIHLESESMFPRHHGDVQISRIESVRPLEQQLSEDVAVIKLTSGSTGSPRGIATRTESLVADDQSLATTMGLADDECILASIPMSHSYGLSSVVMPALMRDSTLVIPSAHLPLYPFADSVQTRVTFVPTSPAFLAALTRLRRPPKPPPSLRLIVSAGAPLHPATALRCREIFDRPVRVFYGASECGGISFDRDGGAAEEGSLGTPVDGVTVTLEPTTSPTSIAPAGSGLVTVDSAAVADGYLDRTSQSTSLGQGRFRTQDLGYFRDAKLFLLGRADDLVNIKGKMVHPREIDEIVARLDGVQQALTLAIHSRNKPTPSASSLHTFIVCDPLRRLSYMDVRSWCLRHLADHKVPRSVVFVPEIPVTARGKPDRVRLERIAWEAHQKRVSTQE